MNPNRRLFPSLITILSLLSVIFIVSCNVSPSTITLTSSNYTKTVTTTLPAITQTVTKTLNTTSTVATSVMTTPQVTNTTLQSVTSPITPKISKWNWLVPDDCANL
jgi:hypothetical protein